MTLLGDNVYWVRSEGNLAVLSFQSYRWQELGSCLLGIGDWHIAQLVEDKIYYFGGNGSTALVAYDTVLCFASEVETQNTPPSGRKFMTAVFASWRNEIITFGGLNDRFQRLNETHGFNVVFKTWKEIEMRGELPQPRTGHSAVCCGTKMYVFGGVNNAARLMGDLWIAELRNAVAPFWAKLKITNGSFPRERSLATFNAFQGMLVLYGGFGENIKVDQDLQVFLPGLKRWQGAGMNVKVDGSFPSVTYKHNGLTTSKGILFFNDEGIHLLSEEGD